MNLCRHCGVELEPDARFCPLCQHPLSGTAEGERLESLPCATLPSELQESAPPPSTRPPTPMPPATKRRVHRYLLEIYSLLAVTAALVVFAVDFSSGLSLTWAWYPLTSLVFLWVVMFLLILCAGRLWVSLVAEIAAVSVLLFVLDRLTAGPDWFLPLALPLTLLAGAMLAFILVIARRMKPPLFTMIAIILLTASLCAVGLDLLLSRFDTGRWSIAWSSVTFACALPVAMILFYLRRRLRSRQEEIRKVLHL